MLTEDHKQQRVEAAHKFLEAYETNGEEFLDYTITWDEIWVHYTTPETKEQCRQWKHSNSPKPRKFKHTACRQSDSERLSGQEGAIVV